MKEGIIKNAYELIIKEIQTIITVSYLIMVGIGMLFNSQKYSRFEINIFEYADVFDFLIAPFQDIRIFWVSLMAIVIPSGLIWLDSFLKKKTPKFYSWLNMGLAEKKWYHKFKLFFFTLLLLYFIFEASSGYANFIRNNIDRLQTISLRFDNDKVIEGQLIGKTKEVVFVHTENKTKIIPVTSLVREMEIIQNPLYIYKTESLGIMQISNNTFMHVSYLETQDFGNVACNGLIIRDNREALIIDTPVDDSTSKELLHWIEESLKCRPIGVVATHFHVDCLAGLKAFHERGVPSYASNKTIDLARSDDKTLPITGFDKDLEIEVGSKKVVNEFLGEGHTNDNIVSYFPSEKVLFGGCLIKEVGAGKGNLADANIQEWARTVEKVKEKYIEVELVIPGHGKPGRKVLLDYTIELFKNP